MFSQKEIPCDTPNKCCFQIGAAHTTLMYYPPSFNRAGENLNPDRNTTSYTTECSACGKKWRVSECMGEKTVKESIIS